MKRKTKIVLGCLGSFLALCFLLFFVLPGFLFGDLIGQMGTGKRFMNSLSDKDIPLWISRSEEFLKQHPNTNTFGYVSIRDVPSDLSTLRIKRIDVLKDTVRYVWAGGLDHTCLTIRRSPTGELTVTAQYDDYHGRQLWPKERR